MTIKRGQDWGSAASLPHGAPVAASDAELATLAGRTSPSEPLGVIGGDLGRTVGTTGDRERLYSSRAHTFSCDVMEVTIDDRDPVLVVAHVAIGSPRRRALAVIANAAWLGPLNINPRSHPNDGKIELIDASGLSWGDRPKALQRARTGTHVPHPDISVRSKPEIELTFRRPVRYRLDGEHKGKARRFVAAVRPDRLTIVV